MFVMRKGIDFVMVRRIVVSKNQLVHFIHVVVTIFHFVGLLGINYFDKLKQVSIFKEYFSADIPLMLVINFLGERVGVDDRKIP